jgi:phosphoglycolate phosphatase-like HAD superfamily hydrolase
MPRPKTIICDIDGTLVFHHGDAFTQFYEEPTLLPGVLEKFRQWSDRAYNIVLITGRRESERTMTEKQLCKLGIFYDQLIMGVGGGQRVLINDLKPSSEEPTAIAFSLKRNAGLSDVELVGES